MTVKKGRVQSITRTKPARMATSDVTRAREIAERAKPNMRLVDVVTGADRIATTADSHTPELEQVRKKSGKATPHDEAAAGDLHMITMEPIAVTDTRLGRRTHTIVADKNQVVGEQG